MKTKEELQALKEEIHTLNQRLAELTAEELEQVTGSGTQFDGFIVPTNNTQYELRMYTEPTKEEEKNKLFGK